MSQIPPGPHKKRLHFWIPSSGQRTAIIAVAALMVAGLLFWVEQRQQTYTLRMSAGDPNGQRHALAKVLVQVANRERVSINLVGTGGSREAIEKVSRGELDIALVQGGIGTFPHVQQVGAIAIEPLHLLVRPKYEHLAISELQGLRLNLSTQGSGTRQTAQQVLKFAGLDPTRYRDSDLSYGRLQNMPDAVMPDGIFTVSLLPSPVVENLIQKHGYRLQTIPFASALALRDFTIQSTTIPAYTYGAAPATPPIALPTVGTQLLLVARDTVPNEAVQRLLRVVVAADFAHQGGIAPVDDALLDKTPEMPLHPGTIAYRNRNKPVITGDVVQQAESLRSFFVSLLVAAFFGWRWYNRRQSESFEKYVSQVTVLEREALNLEKESRLNLYALLKVRQQLSELKSEALERYANGELKGDEMMTSFLAHVTDARNHLNALILYVRGNMEQGAHEKDFYEQQ